MPKSSASNGRQPLVIVIDAADLGAMRSLPQHWLAPDGLKAGSAAQHEIAMATETEDRLGPVRIVGGADTSMKWLDSRGPIHAAIAPMRWPPGDVLPAASVTITPDIPYVPGFLGFRESPALIAAWNLLPDKPDLLIVDGHGRSHPRRCGIATHLGVLLDMPTIGCAKTVLCGEMDGDLGAPAGSRAPLVHKGETVAIALRTRPRARPIYVSTGHRVSLETAVDWVQKLCDGRRLPLPIRLAHDAANAARRAAAQ